MPKRLVMVGEEEAAFLMEAMEIWETMHRGNFSDAAYEKRGRKFNFKRHLEGKYTKAERDEIAQAALALLG